MKTCLVLILTVLFFSTAEAATFTVTNPNDAGAGSLRQAIIDANAAAGDDTITFQNGLSGTIQLTSGELFINSNIVITGRGVNVLSVSGNLTNFRIFNIAANSIVNINNLTVTGGSLANTAQPFAGAGILNAGTLTVTDAAITGNQISEAGVIRGIGVSNSGTLTIYNSTVSNNVGSLETGIGGGIYNTGNLTVVGSTISGNRVRTGGGIANLIGGNNPSIRNSTIYGNFGSFEGAGIYNETTVVDLNSCTVAGNTLVAGGTAGIKGGARFYNTIVANNIKTNNSTGISTPSDVANTIAQSMGNNLIGVAGGSVNWTSTDILNTPANLGPFDYHGGATQTVALLPNSPAIDKGGATDLETDQRGVARPFDFPNVPNAPNGTGADIGAYERRATDVFNRIAFDYDGDGRADVSVFRPSAGAWYLNRSTLGFIGISFGQAGDQIAPADFDGDRITDIAVFRSGAWYRLNSSNNTFTAVQFGSNGDLPVPADYDGDRKADLAVFRPSNGTWYRINSSVNQFTATQFGQILDKPVIGDFDADGKTDIAVFRSSNGTWYRLNSSTGVFAAIQFGANGDIPTAADYDGDGRTDLSVFRPANGYWYRINSASGAFGFVQFGASGDIPAAADYDGDGRADIAVFRPAGGTWYLQRSTAGAFNIQFGANGDVPTPAAFNQ